MGAGGLEVQAAISPPWLSGSLTLLADKGRDVSVEDRGGRLRTGGVGRAGVRPASSAAAGALMFMERAVEELKALTTLPIPAPR